MRSLMYLFACLLLLAAASSCDRHNSKQIQKEGWTPVDSSFDSTSRRLEAAYISYHPQYVRDSLALSLHPTKAGAGAAQRLYWLARATRGNELYDSALNLIEKGFSAIDSSAYPYEWARLASLKASLPNIPVKMAYSLSTNNLQYFEKIADHLMTASTLMRLGSVMWSINDTLPAATYYRRADSIFAIYGPEEYRLKNLVNIANTSASSGGVRLRDSLMNIVISSPMTRQDTSLYVSVLRNKYNDTGDLSYLRKAYRHIDHLTPPARSALTADIAEYFLENEMPSDSVIKYGFMAFSDIARVSDHRTRAMIFNIMAYASYLEKDIDGTVNLYHAFLSERLAMEKERFSLETTKADYRQGFEKARREERDRHIHERTVWIIALIAALSLAVVSGTILYLRVQRSRMRRQKAELELIQSRNYLSACVLAMDEKDRILNSIIESVDKMQNEEKLAASQAAEITTAIKRNLNSGLDTETFTELHKKIHPEFVSRLTSDYPDLTESQLRLAAYIAMGLSSKQIALALNIAYESVKKGRTRLRKRMNLPQGSSLESFLREYATKA